MGRSSANRQTNYQKSMNWFSSRGGRRKKLLRQKRNDENKGHSKRARRAEAPRAPMRSFPQVCQSTSYIMASRICCSALSVADQVFSSSFSYVNTHSLSSGSAFFTAFMSMAPASSYRASSLSTV